MTRVTIIGAGISGLATAYALENSAGGAELEITVIERQPRCGGKIWSRLENGYLCEWGPNGFLDNKPATLQLCKKLAIGNKLLRSSDNARKRFVFCDNALHKLPENGAEFLLSRLLSARGKARLVAEFFIKAKQDDSDETLAEFARRRLGAEALDKLIAPMAGGIFAGDPETMSLQSCFPRIAELEREYGGLLKAMLKLAKQKRQRRAAGEQVASAAGPGGVLTSFDGGIEELTRALSDNLRAPIRTGLGVESIEYYDHFVLELSDGSQIDTDVVINAAPADALAKMLDKITPTAAKLLRTIPYAPLNVVCFGYDAAKLECDLNGFGYLIPRSQGCSVLGTLWDSSIFPHRAPDSKVLLRSMHGGATNPRAASCTDEQIRVLVQADLKRIMGIEIEPEFCRIFRHQRAIPQYIYGHAALVRQLRDELRQMPGLFLTGNAFDGIGLNDCVANAEATAAQALKFIYN